MKTYYSLSLSLYIYIYIIKVLMCFLPFIGAGVTCGVWYHIYDTPGVYLVVVTTKVLSYVPPELYTRQLWVWVADDDHDCEHDHNDTHHNDTDHHYGNDCYDDHEGEGVFLIIAELCMMASFALSAFVMKSNAVLIVAKIVIVII